MKIECTIRRADGSRIDLYNVVYHFRPADYDKPEALRDPRLPHVAEVTDPDAIQRFLSITDAYAIARDDGESVLDAAGNRRARDTSVAEDMQRPVLSPVPQGFPPRVEDMDMEQITAYAATIGMPPFKGNLSLKRRQMNVMAFLDNQADDQPT